jgi:hypothetical protein
MPKRGRKLWKAGAMALSTGLLAVTAWAQPPASTPSEVPVPGFYCAPGGAGNAIGGAVRHAGRALQDGLIGYPKEFEEPPVGYYINAAYKQMRSKADPHRFTLYRSDFLPGTNLFSPAGAMRFNLMASRLSGWPGAIAIEWSPDEPGLAEARRAAIVSIFDRAKLPIPADRVVIAPSPFPGGLGADAVAYTGTLLFRDQMPAMSYTMTPSSASGFGSSGGGR